MGWFRGRKEAKLETKKQARVREREHAVLTPSRRAASGVGSTNEIFTKTLLLPKLQTHPPRTPQPPVPGPQISSSHFLSLSFNKYLLNIHGVLGSAWDWGYSEEMFQSLISSSSLLWNAPQCFLECRCIERGWVVTGCRWRRCVGEVAAERGNRTMQRASENKRCLSLLRGEDQKLPV